MIEYLFMSKLATKHIIIISRNQEEQEQEEIY